MKQAIIIRKKVSGEVKRIETSNRKGKMKQAIKNTGKNEKVFVDKQGNKQEISGLLGEYLIKTKIFRHLGFNKKLESKKWLMQDVLQEAILRCYQSDNTENNYLNRTMKQITIDKWRSANSEQRFIEFSNDKSDIELEHVSVNGHQINSDYWKEYRLTLIHVYKSLGKEVKSTKIEIESGKPEITIKYDRQKNVIFNLYHVKGYSMQEIADKLKNNKMKVSRKVKAINRKLLKSGINELYRMDFIVRDYQIPEYKYNDQKPTDLKPFDQELRKSWGKTYASKPIVIDIADYKEEKRKQFKNGLNPHNNYNFTKQAYKKVKKPVTHTGYINRDMGNPENDLIINDILGEVETMIDVWADHVNDGLQEACPGCGYSIDHCKCNHAEYDDSQAYAAMI